MIHYHSETDFSHNDIVIRHATQEFEGLKVGDFIRKNNSNRIPNIQNKNVYKIKAIIVDSFPQPLILLSNDRTFWFDSIKNNFKVLDDYKGECFNSVNDSVNNKVVNNVVISYLPKPEVFRYQNDMVSGSSHYHCENSIITF